MWYESSWRTPKIFPNVFGGHLITINVPTTKEKESYAYF
jgi:hypothetical protein